MLALLPLLAAGALGFAPQTFHLMKVKEVYTGSDTSPSAQYVVIQMYAAGQNQVGGKQIRVFDRRNTLVGTFTFPLNVPNGADQSTILIGEGATQTFFSVVPDLFATLNLDPLGGKVCFHDPQFLGDIDCVAWGGYDGPPSGVGMPFNVPVGLERGQAIRRRLDICGLPTILDGCDDTDNSSADFLVAPAPAPRNNAGVTGTVPPSICGNNLLQSLEQCDDANLTNGDGCSAQCLREESAFAPSAAVINDGNGPGPSNNNNGVLEPGETIDFKPSWRNASTAVLPLTGRMAIVTGPPGAIYSLSDDNATYGTVPPGAIVQCGPNLPDCFSFLSVTNPTPRPVTHWDVTAAEVSSFYGFKNWMVHVGRSFTDVPTTNPFYKFIETLLHRGVTGGCTATTYCPASTTTRDGMSVFVLVAKEGAGYNPPACGTPVFGDVPASNPFCKFIEELFRRGVVSGCGGGNYCPTSPVTREAMAVFVLRTLDPALNPPACGTPVFNDVPASSPFCKWIEELARRGVVTGCGGGNYCPGAAVTREQMGVFITSTFTLTLYGL